MIASQNCEYVESLMFGFDCRRLIIVGCFSGAEYIVRLRSRVALQCISDCLFDSIDITIISALVNNDGKVWKFLFKFLEKLHGTKPVRIGIEQHQVRLRVAEMFPEHASITETFDQVALKPQAF